MYVRAIDVRSTPDGGELIPEQNDGPDNDDNLGMTSISLECAGLSDPNGKAGKIIVTPRGGTASAAELPTACEGFAIGFQLLSDDPQIALDNTGANNIRIYCSDMKDSATQYVEGYGDYTGQWTDPQFCKERQAICGIKSQVQTRGTYISSFWTVNFELEFYGGYNTKIVHQLDRIKPELITFV